MQPLISPIDHETRTRSYGAHDDIAQSSDEETPLLQHRFPRRQDNGNISTAIGVSLMLMMLMGGVAIGIYLLVLQSDADNMLPPVEPVSVRLINRSMWDEEEMTEMLVFSSPPSFQAASVVIEQTDTRECEEDDTCLVLMKEIKETYLSTGIPYNFLVASDGTVYEGIGWASLSPLYPELSALVLAFIGNFTHVPPPSEQMEAVKRLITSAFYRNYLEKKFTIMGKHKKDVPRFLFEKFKSFPQWKEE